MKLSCYFYPILMVKEYDEGQKGAACLAIVKTEARTSSPCIQTHAEGEKVIGQPEWVGYFKGVKGNLVLFHAADGTNGGMPFVVYDSRTLTKIFQDSAYDSIFVNKEVDVSPFDRLRFISTQHGQLCLKYLRVVEADCDLHSENRSCWEKVRKKFGLKSTQVPVCSGYKGVRTRWVSAVAYPVEVSLYPQPTVRTIGGPVTCWPVD